MRASFHWCCLLMLALIAPIALPAGGGETSEIKIKSGKMIEFCFAGDSCEILSSPSSSGVSLRKIALGTPLQILRVWNSYDGKRWILVQSSEQITFSSSTPNRGWIRV